MPRQLPQSLGAVDVAQAFPITALKTDNRKEGKGGEGKKDIARDEVLLSTARLPSHSPLCDMSASEHQGQGCSLFTQFHFLPITAGGKQLWVLRSLSSGKGTQPWLCMKLSVTLGGWVTSWSLTFFIYTTGYWPRLQDLSPEMPDSNFFLSTCDQFYLLEIPNQNWGQWGMYIFFKLSGCFWRLQIISLKDSCAPSAEATMLPSP